MARSSKYFSNESPDLVDELLRRNEELATRINDLERAFFNQNSPAPLARIDPATFSSPYEGQRAIDESDEQHTWYSDGEWRKAGGAAVYEIKVFEDSNAVGVGDGKFQWPIPRELDGAVLIDVEAGVSTVSSSGSTQIQLHKFEIGSGDMLTTKLTIDSGERNSKDSSVQAVIDTANDDVSWGTWISIDIDAAGTDARGLTIKLTFTPSALAAAKVQGAKGDPGGITSWTGAWSSSTSYTTGQAVSNGGTSYVAIAPSTNVQPGVTSGWETSWMVLAGAQQVSSLVLLVDGNGFPIDIGSKFPINCYFNCTIVEATLLAREFGDISIELWKDTYGNYPPTASDKITGSSPLTLSSSNHTTDTALTGWTTSIIAGDVIIPNIVSNDAITQFTLSLKVLRT